MEKANVPGPGAYEAKSEITKRPSSKFGKGKRRRLHDTVKVPGPGAYKAKKNKFRPKSAYNRSFGLATRNKTIDDPYSNATPGPGSYNISGDIGRNNKKGLIKARSRP